jgi:DNA-binding phage protein
MMPKSVSYQKNLIEYLKNPEKAALYIEACLEEDNPEVLRLAIGDVVEAYSQINQLSETAKILHAKLDVIPAENKVEELYYLRALLDELGFHLAVKVKSGQY